MEVWDKVRKADFRFVLLKTVAMKNGPVEHVYLQMRDSQRPIYIGLQVGTPETTKTSQTFCCQKLGIPMKIPNSDVCHI